MYYYGGRLIKKEIFENDKIAERHEYEYSGYQGPKDKEYYYVAISRPYKTRVCNLEEYQSKYQEQYKECGWGKTVGKNHTLLRYGRSCKYDYPRVHIPTEYRISRRILR